MNDEEDRRARVLRELIELENRPPAPCVGSGLCCKTGPCGFGEWDAERHQCAFLEVAHRGADYEIYRCGKYEEISKQPFANISPAFGAGCCSRLFNADRERIIHVLRKGDDPGAVRALGGIEL